jgi:glycerol-3-phosphate acyltransferase PlsY
MGIFTLIASYFIGSIPFGLFASKIKGVDLTKTGSGNIGATNVFRTLGPTTGIIVFTCDLLKGSVPVYIAKYFALDPLFIIFCASAAVLGHMFSPFMKFKGGKGVATGLGVILGLAPYLFILSFLLGISIIALTGYVSLASITGAILLSILMFRTGQPSAYAWGTFLLTIFIIYKHIPNIKRLMNGTENKITWGKL